MLVHGLVLLTGVSAFASDPVVGDVQGICALVQKGQSSSITLKATGDSGGMLRLLGTGIKGEYLFTRDKYEGLQRVLQEHQSKDYADYRACVKDVLPYFKEKSSNGKKAGASNDIKTTGDKSPVQIGNGNVINY